MFAKIITKDNREYYSAIFAFFSDMWDTTVITYNTEASEFEYVNLYERTPSLKRRVFIFDGNEDDFVRFDTIKLGSFNTLKNAAGYEWILNNKDLLKAIINGEEVDDGYKELGKKYNEKLDVEEWRYVKNKKDIENLLTAAWGFHDGSIARISLCCQHYSSEPSRLEIVFDECWESKITLIFEGDVVCHIENEDGGDYYVYEANIFFENGKVYWTDCSANSLDEIDKDCVYFSGRVLKWKMEN